MKFMNLMDLLALMDSSWPMNLMDLLQHYKCVALSPIPLILNLNLFQSTVAPSYTPTDSEITPLNLIQE